MSAEWTLRCDEPGCDVALESQGVDDRDTTCTLVRHAEWLGWQLAAWLPQPIDLCPRHVRPEIGMRPPITDLGMRGEKGRAR